MNKKLLNGILIGLGVVVIIFGAFPYGTIFALAFWIYLGVMIGKKKRFFHKEIESGLEEKYLKRLKTFLIGAGISFPIAIGSIIIHNVRSGQSGSEETLFFFIAIVALYLFIISTVGGLVIVVKGRQKPNKKINETA